MREQGNSSHTNTDEPQPPSTQEAQESHGEETRGNGLDDAEETRRSAPSSTSNKKMKKSKKKKTTSSQTEDSHSMLAGEALERLQISENTEDDRIDELGRALHNLRQGTNASEAEREISARDAVGIIDILRASLKRHLTSIQLQEGSVDLQHDALDASRAIFLLNKYHRQLPEPPRRPHHLLWKPSSKESSMSSEDKLHKRAGPALDFMTFLTFASHTARALSACGRLSQAKEVMELIERRLIKCKQRSPLFREYVGYFLDSRQNVGIEAATNPLTPEGEKHFEWYASDNGVPDEMTLLQLDMLHGYPVYVRFRCFESFSSPQFDRFITLIDANKTAEMDCVCINRFIAAGAESTAKAKELVSFLMNAANDSGLQLDESDKILATDKLELLGFEFSMTGIVGKSL